MSDKDKRKVLVIISKAYDETIYSTVDTQNCIRSLKHHCLEFCFMVDPSRSELELSLYKNEYLCIIPCSGYSLKEVIGGKYKVWNFNVTRLLASLNFDYFGCDYLTGLMASDKAACLKISHMNPPMKVITRYKYNSCANIASLIDYFPATLEPQYSHNFVSMKKYQASSSEDACRIISELFENDSDIEEIFVLGSLRDVRQVDVIIIGNPPLSINMVYEHSSGKEANEPSENARKFSELIIKSYELFSMYALNDFAQFKYIYNDYDCEDRLVDINVSHFLNETVIAAFMQSFGLDVRDLLGIFVGVCLTRAESALARDIWNELSRTLSDKLMNDLVPLETKIYMNKDYDYRDVCLDLKGRILSPSEENKYAVIELLSTALNEMPVPKNSDSPFLGNPDDNHVFLEQYETIPLHPQNVKDVLCASTNIFNGQMRWHAPSVLNNVDPPIMFNTVAASAITNLYNPAAMTRDSSAGLLKMEKQIVRQLSKLIGWNEDGSAGVFTAGGKVCLTYGIKCGLNRCLAKLSSDKKPIVITSTSNHYSIETSCYQLGLSKSSCVRVPTGQGGTIDFSLFEYVLNENLKNNVPVACIIFSGGNTTHCAVEDIRKGKNIVDKAVRNLSIPYTPYLYYDLVVCWPWLFYNQYDFGANALDIGQAPLKKIKTITDTIAHAYLADGAGIDFHKCGFAPLTNSVFLSKYSYELYDVSDNPQADNFREPYHYTFSNSRGATDIISAWNILQSVGIQGFQSYVANMMTVAGIFASTLPQYGFEIIEKEHTYGFATIVWACNPIETQVFSAFCHLNSLSIDKNNKYLFDLFEFLKKNNKAGYYLRFLPNYIKDMKIAVIAILPTTLNIDSEKAMDIASEIGNFKLQFDEQYKLGLCQSHEIMPEDVPK